MGAAPSNIEDEWINVGFTSALAEAHAAMEEIFVSGVDVQDLTVHLVAETAKEYLLNSELRRQNFIKLCKSHNYKHATKVAMAENIVASKWGFEAATFDYYQPKEEKGEEERLAFQLKGTTLIPYLKAKAADELGVGIDGKVFEYVQLCTGIYWSPNKSEVYSSQNQTKKLLDVFIPDTINQEYYISPSGNTIVLGTSLVVTPKVFNFLVSFICDKEAKKEKAAILVLEVAIPF